MSDFKINFASYHNVKKGAVSKIYISTVAMDLASPLGSRLLLYCVSINTMSCIIDVAVMIMKWSSYIGRV